MTRLRHFRIENKMTLREVAKKVDASIQSVHAQEVRGIRTIKNAKRYAVVFGCDWRMLLDEGESDLLAAPERSEDGSDKK